jgi:phage terminase large subunit-like protein
MTPRPGRRLIQYFFLLISKKNSKSTLAAGIMVTALIRNWRESGEFYILAPTKEIADNSYIPARDMVMADPDLRTILKPSAGRVIEHRNTGAILKVVAADNETVSGKKTIGLLIDELWLFGKRAGAEHADGSVGGLASRPEGFEINLSTQSDAPPQGVFKQRLDEYRDIRDGKVIAPNKLGVLYEFPKSYLKDEKFRDPKTWHITNPNLGASVDERYLPTSSRPCSAPAAPRSSASSPSTSTSRSASRCAPTAGPARRSGPAASSRG